MNYLQKLKADIIVVVSVLAIAGLFFLVSVLHGETGQAVAVIYQDGTPLYRLPLYEEKTVTVHSEDGGYNLILISQGEVWVSDADCPDKLCVKQRRISRNGESIICLPHRLVIQIESEEESALDAVTN